EKTKNLFVPEGEDMHASLKSVTADVGIIKNAMDTMENISFDKLISGPLDACVKAQSDAAKSTLEFIRTVGLKEKNGTQYVATVVFTFVRGGKTCTMNIPLISLVPIPTLAIEQMTYKFKVKIDSTSVVGVTSENSNQSSFNVNIPFPGSETPNQTGSTTSAAPATPPTPPKDGTQPPVENGDDEETNKKKPAGKDATNGKPQKSDVKAVTDDLSKKVLFGVSYSSKKDSKATQYSKYSVETNMDIDITVGKEDMPGGISKMLEILNDSVEITDPNGVLTVTSEKVALENGKAIVKASFKNEDGIYDCSRIRCTGPATVKIVNNVEVAQLVFTTAGIYTVSAGNRNIVVDVVAGAAQTATATTTNTEKEEE
ncbi:MAG: DUF2589 domain-containing protein, partial [Bacteroidales bacterium]|nr:DUF2589 domain-containing protein [Bacteroidales bacterium]